MLSYLITGLGIPSATTASVRPQVMSCVSADTRCVPFKAVCEACADAGTACTFAMPLSSSRNKRVRRGLGLAPGERLASAVESSSGEASREDVHQGELASPLSPWPTPTPSRGLGESRRSSAASSRIAPSPTYHREGDLDLGTSRARMMR